MVRVLLHPARTIVALDTLSMMPPVPERPALFLDFDGTLVEIADGPEKVVVADELPGLFQELVRRTGGAVAVVSGRKVADIDRHLAIPIAAAGMHGLERRAEPSGAVSHAPPPGEIATLRARIEGWDKLGGGVFMEDKGAGLAVHYRAAPELGDMVKSAMAGFIADLHTLHLIEGKMVVEAKGKGFDKGSSVRAFMQAPPFKGRTPVFIGDDVTDEDGIRAAEALGGFGIKVGEGASAASHRLPDVASVHSYLDRLATSAAPE